MPRQRTITVTGMTGTGCENSVENALKNVPGIRDVTADHGDETVEVVVTTTSVMRRSATRFTMPGTSSSANPGRPPSPLQAR